MIDYTERIERIKAKRNIYETVDEKTMKLTIISKTHGTHETLFDAEDYELLKQYTHCIVSAKKKKQKAEPTIKYYAMSEAKGKRCALAIIIMEKEIEEFKKQFPEERPVVDHINRVSTLDNRKQNLRVTDYAGNNKNRTPRNGKASPFLGVTYLTRDKTFAALIGSRPKGKKFSACHLYFHKTDDAMCGLAYLIGAFYIHGASANYTDNWKVLPEEYKDTKGEIYQTVRTKVLENLTRKGWIDENKKSQVLIMP